MGRPRKLSETSCSQQKKSNGKKEICNSTEIRNTSVTQILNKNMQHDLGLKKPIVVLEKVDNFLCGKTHLSAKDKSWAQLVSSHNYSSYNYSSSVAKPQCNDIKQKKQQKSTSRKTSKIIKISSSIYTPKRKKLMPNVTESSLLIQKVIKQEPLDNEYNKFKRTREKDKFDKQNKHIHDESIVHQVDDITEVINDVQNLEKDIKLPKKSVQKSDKHSLLKQKLVHFVNEGTIQNIDVTHYGHHLKASPDRCNDLNNNNYKKSDKSVKCNKTSHILSSPSVIAANTQRTDIVRKERNVITNETSTIQKHKRVRQRKDKISSDSKHSSVKRKTLSGFKIPIKEELSTALIDCDSDSESNAIPHNLKQNTTAISKCKRENGNRSFEKIWHSSPLSSNSSKSTSDFVLFDATFEKDEEQNETLQQTGSHVSCNLQQSSANSSSKVNFLYKRRRSRINVIYSDSDSSTDDTMNTGRKNCNSLSNKNINSHKKHAGHMDSRITMKSNAVKLKRVHALNSISPDENLVDSETSNVNVVSQTVGQNISLLTHSKEKLSPSKIVFEHVNSLNCAQYKSVKPEYSTDNTVQVIIEENIPCVDANEVQTRKRKLSITDSDHDIPRKKVKLAMSSSPSSLKTSNDEFIEHIQQNTSNRVVSVQSKSSTINNVESIDIQHNDVLVTNKKDKNKCAFQVQPEVPVESVSPKRNTITAVKNNSLPCVENEIHNTKYNKSHIEQSTATGRTTSVLSLTYTSSYSPSKVDTEHLLVNTNQDFIQNNQDHLCMSTKSRNVLNNSDLTLSSLTVDNLRRFTETNNIRISLKNNMQSSCVQSDEVCDYDETREAVTKKFFTTDTDDKVSLNNNDTGITRKSKQSEKEGNQDINTRNTKKFKLNRSNWINKCSTTYESNSIGRLQSEKSTINSMTEKIEIVDLPTVRTDTCTTGQLVESSKKCTKPKIVEEKISMSHAVEKDDKIEEQSAEKPIDSSTSIGSTTINYNLLQDQYVPLKYHQSHSLIKNELSSNDDLNVSFTKRTIQNVDITNDDDCISLFTNLSFGSELQDDLIGSRNDERFPMFENTFDTYVKNTQSEFNKAYETVMNDNNQTDIQSNKSTELSHPVLPVKESSVTIHAPAPISVKDHFTLVENIPNATTGLKLDHNVSTFESETVAKKNNIVLPLFYFRGYCYAAMRNTCVKNQCHFTHNFTPIILKLYDDYHTNFLEVMDHLARFRNFLKIVYTVLVANISDIRFIVRMLGKLHEMRLLNPHAIQYTIVQLLQKNVPLKLIISELISCFKNDEDEYLGYILMEAQKHIKCGNYWMTLKDLLFKMKNRPKNIVEHILHECLTTHAQYAQEINKYLIQKLSQCNRSQIDSQLMSAFEKLFAEEKEQKVVSGIASPDSDRPIELVPQSVIENDSYESGPKSDHSFRLYPIKGLPRPRSDLSRKVFWKFYIHVHSLQEGLKYKDYDHVINILKEAQSSESTWYSRACFEILCREIKYSQCHLRKIISLTVRTGATLVLHKILFEVAVCLLIRLVDQDYWVLAYKILKDINTIVNLEMCSHQFDAATILLFIQIYLANQRAHKALILLKQSNIIYTHRNKWNVRNKETDDYIRSKTVAFLLDALCDVSVEHALFLFEFLVLDQSNNVYPIDLTRSVNKIVSILLLKKDADMIISIGRLIDKYDFILNTITYRALIAMLVHIDLDLAKQLYQNAVNMGIYTTMRLHPTIFLIVNPDWVEEEMYLAILDLIQNLLLHIGHGIDHVTPMQFSVYLFFEIVSSDNQLFRDEGSDEYYDKKMTQGKAAMKDILLQRFDPPIRIVLRNSGRLLKINTKSLLEYIRSEHCD